MSVYFKLISKSTGEQVYLADADEILCKELGVESHNREYLALMPGDDTETGHRCSNWVDTVGLMLAVGKSWVDIISIYSTSPRIKDVVRILSRDYDVENWRV